MYQETKTTYNLKRVEQQIHILSLHQTKQDCGFAM
jgi:hypothetical protein